LEESALEESTPGLAPEHLSTCKTDNCYALFTKLQLQESEGATHQDTTRYILRPNTDSEQILIVLHVSLYIVHSSCRYLGSKKTIDQIACGRISHFGALFQCQA
jgi:hypothetical protein